MTMGTPLPLTTMHYKEKSYMQMKFTVIEGRAQGHKRRQEESVQQTQDADAERHFSCL